MLHIAILDLYEGQPNQGMRCIHEIIHQWSSFHDRKIKLDVFDVRLKNEIPDLSYDIYISSGGPGSPLKNPKSNWEPAYFDWITKIEDWNKSSLNNHKKSIFFICHSFQLACQYYKVATVAKRKSKAFGVFPVHVSPSGETDPVFYNLKDPFYVVDIRDWQAIEPDLTRLQNMGAEILCIEKHRPHVPYEQAIMGIRFSDYVIGTQFHPEADAKGMSIHLQTEEKKKIVIDTHGIEKWHSMIEHLNDPDKIMWTYAHLLPNFLTEASRFV